MTPTNGAGSDPASESGAELVPLPVDGSSGSLTRDTSPETVGSRREGRLRMAVLRSLQQRECETAQ